MRRHTADVQARRQDGGAGRALRHLGDPVGKFFPLKILAGILYFPVPGVEKKKKLPVSGYPGLPKYRQFTYLFRI
jgi:hypothetical protein